MVSESLEERPGKRERRAMALREAAAAGDPMALTLLQRRMAEQLESRARAHARRVAADRWRGELNRIPLVPESSSEDAVLIDLPTIYEARPNSRRKRYPRFETIVVDAEIRRETGIRITQASGIITAPLRKQFGTQENEGKQPWPK